MSNFKSDYKKLLSIEEEYNLYSLKINDKYVWPYLRNKVYGLIHRKYNLNTGSSAFYKKEYSLINKQTVASQVESEYDAIIFNFTRKEFDEEFNLFDDRTKIVKDNLIEQNISFLEVDFNNELMFTNTDPKIRNCDDAYITYFTHKNSFKFDKERVFLEKISEIISKEIKIEFNAFDYEEEVGKKIQVFQEYFKNIYIKVKPKFIVVTSNYMANEYIIPAKELGIPVIETQYAAITDLHNGYDYNNNIVPTYPDVMLTWSKYFRDYPSFPSNIKDKQVIGFTKMNQFSNYDKKLEEKNNVLVISQNLMSNQIITKAIDFARENEDYNFTVRLHPNEKLSKQLEMNICKCPNIHIGNETLTKQLSKAEFVIGLSSTVLYDACQADKKVIIIDGYSADFFEDLIRRKYALSFMGYKLDSYDFKNVTHEEIYENPKVYEFTKFKRKQQWPKYNDDFKEYLITNIKKKVCSKRLYDNTKELENILNKKEKLISIIVPCYNVEDTILRTLYSISKIQNEDIYEVIVVNDGSTDNTLEILESFKGIKNYKVINFEKGSGGPAKPRMTGVKEATTENIYFFDAGDYLNAKVFLDGLALFKDYDYMRFSNAVKYENERVRFKVGPTCENLSINRYMFNAPFLWNGFYKKSIILDNNIQMNDGLAEDFNFNIKYLAHIKSNFNYNQDLLVYYKEDSVISKDLKFSNIKKLSNNNLDSLNYLVENIDLFGKGTLNQFINRNLLEFMFYNTNILNIINDYTEEEKEELIEIFEKYNKVLYGFKDFRNIDVLDYMQLIERLHFFNLSFDLYNEPVKVYLTPKRNISDSYEFYVNNKVVNNITLEDSKKRYKINVFQNGIKVKISYKAYSIIETDKFYIETIIFKKNTYIRLYDKSNKYSLFLVNTIKKKIFYNTYMLLRQVKKKFI